MEGSPWCHMADETCRPSLKTGGWEPNKKDPLPPSASSDPSIWLLSNIQLIITTHAPSPLKESESEVAQSCPTLYDPMDGSLPGSVVHGLFQARILEWAAISFSRGSSQARDWTRVSCIADRRFTVWATREAQAKSYSWLGIAWVLCNNKGKKTKRKKGEKSSSSCCC